MKSSFRFAILPALVCAVVPFLSFACDRSTRGGDPDPGPDPDRDREEIVSFFSAHLTGGTASYMEDSSIDIDDIARLQTLVWEAWKEANDVFDEQKLIAATPLSQGNSGSWNLPADLEPNAVMNYYWGTKGDKPGAGYPLFLYLHGSGDRDSEWTGGRERMLTFDDAPSIYFIPQIPNTGEWYRWYQRSKQFAWEKLLRQAYLSGEVDPDRIYFFGISEGGYGSQRLGSFYADYLAGAGPMAGGEPLKNAPPENCRNTAFSLRTGANDTGFGRNVITEYTKEAFDALEASSPGDYVHFIELVSGAGHGIDYKPTTPWLAQHTRNPYPKRVSWENFEMDGRYRNGFHNLLVGERSNADATTRTHYEMTIEGNDISLDVELATYTAIETLSSGVESKFDRSYVPAGKGKVTIYLCGELVDLARPVTVTVNGKKAFEGVVEPRLEHIVNSCAAFFDPARLYPAAVEIDLEKL